LAQSQKSRNRQCGAFNHLDSTAELFIEHPFRNKKLSSIREGHLYLVTSEGGTLPYQRYSLAIMRMVRVVDLSGQNMRIV
jgi:hypothetical protein